MFMNIPLWTLAEFSFSKLDTDIDEHDMNLSLTSETFIS